MVSHQGSSQSEKLFEFGKNWASYAALVGEREIEEAKKGLLRLVPAESLRGRSFLDIGCGSGLHAVAAARLGVSAITAIDIDPDSVATTRALLERNGVSVPWRAECMSVFDLDPQKLGRFAIVYAWGVLHHTGNMMEAIGRAASVVEPGGLFAFALYRRTAMDWFWQREKRWYARAAPRLQRIAKYGYLSAFRIGCAVRGIDYRNYVASYRSLRGMDFYHDVHDWLGGYPYETAAPSEIAHTMAALDFTAETIFAQPRARGLLGSGCDEYVYRKFENGDA
jgi:SAM-dependent methyltransferase